MVDEDAKHALEVRSVEDEEPVEALRARGADEALGDRVRFRRSNRRPDDLDAFASEDGVEVARVLAVAIADKEAKRRRSVSQCPGELAGLLGDPGAVWVGGAAGEVYAPAAELNEEEHVEPLQPDGFDGEEVDRDHALGLRSQELAPTEARALAGRSEASLAKQVAHRRRRYREAEPAELTGDPLVAPAPVLPGEPKNQVPDLAADRRAADPTGIPPALRDQPTVPSKERRRSDDKRAPARSRQQPAGRGKEHPINGFQLGATGLTPEHLQLVELLGAKTQRPKLQKASEHDVTERPEQDRLLQDDGTGRRLYESDSSRPTRNRVNAPHRLHWIGQRGALQEVFGRLGDLYRRAPLIRRDSAVSKKR